MAETISGSGRKSRKIVIKGFNPNYIIERRANGATIKPGYFVTNNGQSNNDDIVNCGAGVGALGVALEHYMDDGLNTTVRDTPDIDTAYSDNATVRVALLGSGMVCLVFLEGQTTTTAIYGGTKLVAASTGACQLPTFATSTAQLSADFLGYVGKSIEYDAGGSTAKVIAVCI